MFLPVLLAKQALRLPLINIPTGISTAFNILVSLARLQSFLLLDEVRVVPVAVEEDYVQKLLHPAMRVLDHLPPWQCSTEAGS